MIIFNVLNPPILQGFLFCQLNYLSIALATVFVLRFGLMLLFNNLVMMHSCIVLFKCFNVYLMQFSLVQARLIPTGPGTRHARILTQFHGQHSSLVFYVMKMNEGILKLVCSGFFYTTVGMNMTMMIFLLVDEDTTINKEKLVMALFLVSHFCTTMAIFITVGELNQRLHFPGRFLPNFIVTNSQRMGNRFRWRLLSYFEIIHSHARIGIQISAVGVITKAKFLEFIFFYLVNLLVLIKILRKKYFE